jgi:UPF0755 protein
MESKGSLRNLVFTAVFVLLLTAGLRELNRSDNSYPNYANRVLSIDEPSINVEIPAGASGTQIAQILLEAQVVKSTESYFRAAVANPKSSTVAPGTHRLVLKISGEMAVSQLLDPARNVGLIKINEGAWNTEVFAQLIKAGFNSPELAVAAKEVQLPNGISSLEGVLFPAQYSFAKGTSAKTALQSIVDKFNSSMSSFDFVDARGQLSKQDLVIIASMIQAEGDTKDFSKVSQVIRNRLALNMPLQLDSTVHFLRGVRGEIFLSKSATTLKSAFNTYQNRGLPPAPIGNPGLLALKAAAAPATGDALFFITVSPGDTRFTKSFTEFSSWKLLYQKNRKAGAFE